MRSLTLPALLAMLLMAGPTAACRADRLDDYVRQRMARNHVPGLALVVVRGGKLLKLQGYGTANLEWNGPVTAHTRFQLASATKPFTGLLLLLLAREGRLSLQDPVTRFFPDAPPTWKEITLRHLATHTSGLAEVQGDFRTADDVISAAQKRPLDYPPGTRSAYGSVDYVLLLRVLEKVSGKTFPQLLRERLLAPLGMADAGFDQETGEGPIRTSDLLPQRASLYQWRQDTQHNFSFLYSIPYYAAGGLYASASDLARLAVALDRSELLDPASLGTLWTAPELPGGGDSGFSVGWVVRRYQGRKAVGHSGGPALADLLHFPQEQLTIAVLTNQQSLYPYLAEGVADLLLPTPPELDRGVEDRDPALTAVHRRVLEDAASGKVDRSLFAPEASAGLLPALQGMGPQIVGGLDPIQRIILREDRQNGPHRIRRYRVLFGTKPMLWTFELDSSGKIASMNPGSE